MPSPKIVQSGVRGKENLAEKSPKIDMHYLFCELVKYNASDLHIKADRPPLLRINGKIIPIKMNNLSRDAIEAVIHEMLTPYQVAELEQKRHIDLSVAAQDLGRFRCNIYFQRGSLSAAIRMIPNRLPTLEALGVPIVIKELCQRPRGLILITGATGSGKSTTLAAITQYINETSPVHVLTIEDPIEYIYEDAKASITQREIGSDVISMNDALVAGLRQDPDIIMLGELQELKTIQTAMTAAETGHLVFSTLHTKDAKSSIDRILDVFHSDAQNQIRIQLASTLLGVFCQQLLPRADGKGLTLVTEVMIKSPAIENYILKNELERISDAMANSKDYYQMQTMNQALEKLILAGIITLEEGLQASSNPDDLKLRLSGVDREEGYISR